MGSINKLKKKNHWQADQSQIRMNLLFSGLSLQWSSHVPKMRQEVPTQWSFSGLRTLPPHSMADCALWPAVQAGIRILWCQGKIQTFQLLLFCGAINDHKCESMMLRVRPATFGRAQQLFTYSFTNWCLNFPKCWSGLATFSSKSWIPASIGSDNNGLVLNRSHFYQTGSA